MWRQNAVCVDVDPELFFPVSAEGSMPYLMQLRKARDVCGVCPVWRQCVDEAVRFGLVGIWGGTTERERRSLRSVG